MNKEDIIPARDPNIIQAELSEQLLLRKTNRAGNEIYIFHANDAPNTMLEIGRLREIAFRGSGGGTGLPADIDAHDIDPNGYRQLVVWDPQKKQLIGGYRYILGGNVASVGEQTSLSSNEIFHFSKTFIEEYIPKTIELGRSFVRMEEGDGKILPASIFALDNLWDGLGGLILIHEEYQYFFGKVTMYQDYNKKAKDLIAYYFQTYFQGDQELMHPIHPISIEVPISELRAVIKGDNPKADYKNLSKTIRDMGTTIPPLVNSYLGLSSSLMYFGTSVNPHFGNVEETAIMIPMEEISDDKIRRHVESFIRDASKRISPGIISQIKKRFGLSIKEKNKEDTNKTKIKEE